MPHMAILQPTVTSSVLAVKMDHGMGTSLRIYNAAIARISLIFFAIVLI